MSKMQMNEIKNFQQKNQKFDPLVTPKRGHITDKKYLRLVPPQGRKFGVIDTPQNFQVQPPVSQKRIERPPNFF